MGEDNDSTGDKGGRASQALQQATQQHQASPALFDGEHG